jgi:putative hydrolase of the HAD superfamily
MIRWDYVPPAAAGEVAQVTQRGPCLASIGFSVPDALTLFFDVGGVLLTNAWDTPARNRAIEAFGLDGLDFHTRHGMVKTAFETGRLSLDAYIEKTVFYTDRSFSRDDFKQFMFDQSKELGGTLDWVRSLAASGRHRLLTLNNESRELHEYRVRNFGLCSVFQAFLTSCYLGQAKPDEEIYRNAVGIAGCQAARGIFIDDRPVNVETALKLGLRAIRFLDLDQLRSELADAGVAPA